VLGWAALGLLRVLPRIQAAQADAGGNRSSAVHVDRRFPTGDPRRHRRFAV
jgi:hypothetical protein